MSSVVIKLGSLLIKTLSKPIANKIKDQARQHERFRQICIQSAQAIHRWDMRFKLGLLQDSATQEKQARREAAEAQAAKHKHDTPTVKTESQTLADEERAAKEREREEKGEKKKESAKPKVKIRPLSEAKAIDSGANFVSETFLLLVGVALILGENWRQNRKQKSRRDDDAERIEELEEYKIISTMALVELEKELSRQWGEGKKRDVKKRILPPKVYELVEREENERQPPEKQGLWEWIRSNIGGNTNTDVVEKATSAPTPMPISAPSPPSSPSILSRILSSPEENELIKPSQMSTEHRENTSKPSEQHAGDVRPSTK